MEQEKARKLIERDLKGILKRNWFILKGSSPDRATEMILEMMVNSLNKVFGKPK